MKTKLDFTLLRARILLVAVVCVVGIIMVISSNRYRIQQDMRQQSAATELEEIRAETEQVRKTIKLVETYRNDYDRDIARGFLGQENRLSWIEQLEGTARALGLSNLRYDIEAQRPVASLLAHTPSTVKLRESRLHITTGLLHEGDLITLLDSLARLRSGLFVIDHCKINRPADMAGIASTDAFQAECDTRWFTASYDPATGVDNPFDEAEDSL
ncbi:MAG TPA: hypothetical protein DCZ13_11240 [Porticoccaceae bacterium]|nr:hypothetical protein [Porticoccaceae bacterium]